MAKMRNGVWEPGIHIDFSINFWKISGFLYIAVFCAAAVIGDLILREVSGQEFFVSWPSSIWMIVVIITMGPAGLIMGTILCEHERKESVKGFVIAAFIVAAVISGLFTYDVSYISGKFVALNDVKILSCETNSSWINPFEVDEIHRFDDNVTISLAVDGNNVSVSVPISQNGSTLYRNFSIQDSLTAYIKKVVEDDTNGMFQFQLE